MRVSIFSTARATGTVALLTAFMTASSLVAQPQTQAFYPLLTDLVDASGNNGPVILSGAGGPPPSLPSNGVCSNGIRWYNTGGQNIETPRIANLDLTDFEINVDFNMTALPAGNRPVVHGGNSYRWLGIALQANGTVGIKYNNNNYLWSSTTLTPGTWYSASLKYESGVVALFINGAPVHVAAIGTLNHANDTNVQTIDWSTGNCFHGCIRNLLIANDTTIDAARWSVYGLGCVGGGHPGFYERFQPSHAWDLSGAGVTMRAAPPSYVLTQGASAIVQPTTAPQTIQVDETIQVALPWTFPHQGGATNDLWVCSNGWIALEPTTLTEPYESVSLLLSGPTRICAMWDDLNPVNATGGVYWEQDPTNASLFHVTFLGVPEDRSSGGGSNDFQYTFHQSGDVELKWGTCSVGDCLVGFALGNGQGEPWGGATDISGVTVKVLGDGVLPLGLHNFANDRPVLGTTFDMEVSEIPGTATLGAMVYSFMKQDPGISLTSIGMDTCFQYLDLTTTVAFVPAGPTFNTQVVVPNLPQIVGMHVYAQAAIFGSTATALGVVSSNGGDMLLDVH